MTTTTPPAGQSVGTPVRRVDAPLKVTGSAPYAYEHEVENPCYLWPVPAPVARGAITSIEVEQALAVPGVLHVLTHEDSPRLIVKSDPALWILQGPEIAHRGQIVGGVIAETPEAAREAAELVVVHCDEDDPKVELDPHDPAAESVKKVNGRPGTETKGDPDQGWEEAAFRVDHEYEHTDEYHVQMEPHAVIATWHDVSTLDPRPTRLTLFDANQGPIMHEALLPPLLGLLPNQIEIISPYVGGAFGGKAFPHPHIVLAAMAAKTVRGRPVKLALTRQQTFHSVGHRAKSSQHVRLGAGADGRLTMIEHVSTQAASRLKSSVDQSCMATRMMYATPARRTEHRTVELDVGPETWMRAPGDFTGMFALETAMDELAREIGMDPVELRIRNEPEVDPETDQPWSTRALVACLRRAAELFGWGRRHDTRTDGEWLIGHGMASSCYPNNHIASLFSRITYTDGSYVVQMQAADIGTGAHTVLRQIAADALGVPVDQVTTDIGRTGTPLAIMAGGSQGTYEWGNAVVAACEKFRRRHGDNPAEGASARAQGKPPRGADKRSRHSFGAQFAEVAVSQVTAEVRVRRLLGVYAAGTIINPLTARSQMIGGMTMAQSAALYEEAYRDPRFGHVVNSDLAGYHVAAHADIGQLDVEFLPEHDKWYGAKGSKGIGELAMVGTPASIGNAIFDATGIRLRELPFTPASLIEAGL